MRRSSFSSISSSLTALQRTMLVKSNAETRDIGHLWYARKKFSFGRRGTKQYLQYCYAKVRLLRPSLYQTLASTSMSSKMLFYGLYRRIHYHR